MFAGGGLTRWGGVHARVDQSGLRVCGRGARASSAKVAWIWIDDKFARGPRLGPLITAADY